MHIKSLETLVFNSLFIPSLVRFLQQLGRGRSFTGITGTNPGMSHRDLEVDFEPLQNVGWTSKSILTGSQQKGDTAGICQAITYLNIFYFPFITVSPKYKFPWLIPIHCSDLDFKIPEVVSCPPRSKLGIPTLLSDNTLYISHTSHNSNNMIHRLSPHQILNFMKTRTVCLLFYF